MSTLFELTLMSESMTEHKGVGRLMHGSDYDATYGRRHNVGERVGDNSGAPGMAKRKYHVLIYGSIVE